MTIPEPLGRLRAELMDFQLLSSGQPPRIASLGASLYQLTLGGGMFCRNPKDCRFFQVSGRWLNIFLLVQVQAGRPLEYIRFEITYAAPHAGEIRWARDPDPNKVGPQHPEWHLDVLDERGAAVLTERVPLAPFDPVELVEGILKLERHLLSQAGPPGG